MRFRPCIDLHNGRVKIMTEAGLTGETTPPMQDASFYAAWYALKGFTDGFLMLHNRDKDPIFEKTYAEARRVLFARPKEWSVGGKMTPEIAEQALSDGAKRVVFSSYVFRAGGPDMERLKRVHGAFGKERLILHLRLVRRDSSYCLLSGALDHGTTQQITEDVLTRYAAYCSEMIVETPGRFEQPSGRQMLPAGADESGAPEPEGAGTLEMPLALMLAKWNGLPVTYLRGVENESDLNLLEQMGQERIDFSVGGALSLYGGDLPEDALSFYRG